MVNALEILAARALLRPLRLQNSFCSAPPIDIFAPADPLKASIENLHDPKLATGAVVLDVFKVESRPYSSRNIAMLYVVGPKGQRIGQRIDQNGPRSLHRGEFLRSTESTSKRAIELVALYNRIVSARSTQLAENSSELSLIWA